MELLPLYLLTPSTTAIAPPLTTNQQELPVEQLAWQDFERLCLRLVQAKAGVTASELYGIRGQDQQGIDIFVRKPSGTYATYQCKRCETLTPGALREIVELFLKGQWAAKSDEFVLCTTAALNTTQQQDEFEKLRDELAARGIGFSKWDKVQLPRLLKEYPPIVYDFFGREWVKLFNGPEAYERLHTEQQRLDANLVVKYRQELAAFYAVVFNHYDPGLTIPELYESPFLLQQRFIVPDVYEVTTSAAYSQLSTKPVADTVDDAVREQAQDMHTHRQQQRAGLLKPRHNSTEQYYRPAPKTRVRFEVQLVRHPRSIIIGDPGAGKSTLLRYLTLDLLSSSPTLETVARQLPGRLPVWLPFAYLTKQLTVNANYSLTELLHLWFSSMDKKHLADLVQLALQDERLLLLIDGVDEWNSLAAAEQTIAKIEIQASLRGVPVVYSSRPYGYKLLQERLLNVRQLELAPFSRPQQRAFVRNWYEQWLRAIGPGSTERAPAETNNFFAELDKSNDLKHLAENPLLLSILVAQKLRDSVLPRNKLRALQDITDYLVNKHPGKRQWEAGIVDEVRWDFELNDVFAELAFYIQGHSNDGAVAKTDAAHVVEGYLNRMMGYEPAKAKKLGREFVDLSANSIGILIEKSTEEVAFRHRQFQEYLAARYLYESDKEETRSLLQTYAAEQTWNQVLLTFFNLIPAKKTTDFTDFMAQVNYEGPDRAKAHYVRFLRYDICLRLPNSPNATAREALTQIQYEFEYEQDEAVKQLLLQLLLGAAENPKLKAQIFTYLNSYFPNVYPYNDYRTTALRAVPVELLSVPQKAFLVKALLNGNTATKLTASATLGRFLADEWVWEQVQALLNGPTRPDLLAFALNSVAASTGQPERQAAALAQVPTSVTGALLLFSTKLKVELKQHTEQDLLELLAGANGLENELDEELTSLLATGWPTDPLLLEACLAGVELLKTERSSLKKDLAWKLLFHGFHDHEQVIDWLVTELETQEYPLHALTNYQGWQYMVTYFRDSPRVVAAIDQWLLRVEGFRELEVAFACLVGRTPVAREYLLRILDTSVSPQWPMMALLDGWGDDPQVLDRLREYFRRDSPHKDSASHYVSQLFREETAEGVAILEKILFDRERYDRNRAVVPLVELDRDYFVRQLLGPFLEHELGLLSKELLGQYYNCLTTLVEQCHTDERVRALVFAEASQHDVYAVDLLIRYYPTATEVIDRLLAYSQPLAASYRLPMIEKLGERYLADEQSLQQLASFEQESDNLLRSEAAVQYFTGIKNAQPEIIRAICTRLAHIRYIGQETSRQIGFVGFLLLNDLPAYFALPKDSYTHEKPSPAFEFENRFNKHEPILLKVLVEHFDVLYAGIQRNFEVIADSYALAEPQRIWGALAKHSTVDSPTAPYLLNFVEQHADTITNPDLLAWLATAAPGSQVLKRIALRMLESYKREESAYAGEVIGQQFMAYADVRALVATIEDTFCDTGKIVAACIGWPDLPQLRALFEKAIATQEYIDHDAGFNLKFLFRDVPNIMAFLAQVVTHEKDMRYHHRYFIQPLLARIVRDEFLQDSLMEELGRTSDMACKVSYYALLTRTNAKAADLAKWKQAQQSYLSSRGYNIVENRSMSLSETLREIWY
ncbi:NACHT domain-containing protein [Hymenobacter antarcticus]|uniref:NACHT domain-containing protein n=1 Tax=Hymenobacter antarcticus TaxID=486270 RepID=A0ABP7PR92_9BACT